MAEKKGNKNDLQARYEALPPEQQREILSRAAKLRKAAMVRKDVRDDWMQEMLSGKLEDSRRREHKLGKLDDDLGAWILKAMSKADEMGIWDSKSAQSQAEMAEGVVTILSRGGGVLLTQAGQEREFMIRPELAMVQKTDLSVGEKVLWSEGPNGRALLERALPRSSILSRPDPTRPEVERVIAVNMDYVGMVASIVVPLFNPSLVDRFLIGIRQSGAKPLLVVTKVDLLDEEAMFLLERLETYRGLGIPVFEVSSTNGLGVPALRAFLQDKTTCLLGTSGVGKSSILNALDPELDLETGENRPRVGGKGSHTTVMASIHPLDASTRIVDTPGIREFNFLDLRPEEVKHCFNDFDPFLPCRYNDCTHLNEDACAVRNAADEERLSPERYESYVKIMESLPRKQWQKGGGDSRA